jgi:hypothetical protein
LNRVDATVAYIAGQQEHHRKRDFQAEYVAFLKKHQIDYDPRYLWGWAPFAPALRGGGWCGPRLSRDFIPGNFRFVPPRQKGAA